MTGPARVVAGPAQATVLDGVEGKVLFPSMSFSAWPPFSRWAETTESPGRALDIHPHEREEVITYVLSGTVRDQRSDGTVREVKEGHALLVSAARPLEHDELSAPGQRSRWISLILRLPPGASQPKDPYQLGTARPGPAGAASASVKRVVGPEGPVRSSLGLEMEDITYPGPATIDLEGAPDASTLLYVLDGRVRSELHDLAPGFGLLSSARLTEQLRTEGRTRVLVSRLPSPDR